MRTLYIDCSMGIAGDMFMGALLELASDQIEFINRINSIGIPNIAITAEKSIKCGITGTHVNVRIKGVEELSQDVPKNEYHHESHKQNESIHDEYYHEKYEHEHYDYEEHIHEQHYHEKHEQEHHDHEVHYQELHSNHQHITMQDISNIIMQLKVPKRVKKDIIAIYQIIAEAESKVHGKEVSEVHFHEVGMMDAIADIAGCALLIHELHIDQIVAAPINVGFGQVKCAHGILPIPAPATANILVGVPSYAGSIRGELCTPTGAALLKYYVKSFSNMPTMIIQKVGYGMGTKDFEAANCVRAILGNGLD